MAVALLVAASVLPAGVTAVAAPLRPACGGQPAPHHARCFATYRPDVAPDASPGGLWPRDIVSAYALPTSKGSGQTVAIVDAYDNPKAESDLAAYRKKFGLPACTTGNHCFRKVNQRGVAKPLPPGDPDWAVETSLDLDSVSAACPKCKILLVEADSDDLGALGASVNMAVKLGSKIVSNSYGATEFNGVSAYGKRYYTHAKVAIVVSSGDESFGPANFPAAWQRSISVGGTTLRHSTSGWKETAWSGAGSGCSAYIAKPPWQVDKHCLMRTVADVCAVADPETGLAVYDTYGLGPDDGWIQVGGTSLAAPLIAGMIGLAGNATALGNAAFLYARKSQFRDVVGGSNGSCGRDYLCTAVRGYDAPTGLGTPHGVGGL